LVRVYDFSLAQVGAAIGPLKGVAGIGGVLLGGFVADRLARRDERWRLWTPGLACLLVLPFVLVFLLSPDMPVVLAALGAAHLATAMHMAPIYAVCMAVAKPSARATAAAVYLFCGNLI